MSVINLKKREVQIKIVYYGPGRGGKTTNLEYVHQNAKSRLKSDLIKIDTKGDRTLFFDFLPFSLGKIKGFDIRVQLYTVPGQQRYEGSRRLVLRGVDGVVFVADSQDEKMAENIESLEDLEKNLSYYGKKVEELPMVLQYNKRDLPNAAPLEEMRKLLNPTQVPDYEASAATGEGVFETLKSVAKGVLTNLNNMSPSQSPTESARPSPMTATDETRRLGSR